MIDIEIVHLFGKTYGAFDTVDYLEQAKGSYGYVVYCMAYKDLKGQQVYNIVRDCTKEEAHDTANA
jgi:hypothetical protein